MKLLLDECVPESISGLMTGHSVKHVEDMGWRGLKNGGLLSLAKAQFDVQLTTDRHLPHQQNLAKDGIAVVIIAAKSNKHEDIATWIPDALIALSSLAPGEVKRIPPA